MNKTSLPGIFREIEAAERRRNEKAGYAIIGTLIVAVAVTLLGGLAYGVLALGIGFLVMAVIR